MNSSPFSQPPPPTSSFARQIGIAILASFLTAMLSCGFGAFMLDRTGSRLQAIAIVFMAIGLIAMLVFFVSLVIGLIVIVVRAIQKK